jgi:hypothetical protein
LLALSEIALIETAGRASLIGCKVGLTIRETEECRGGLPLRERRQPSSARKALGSASHPAISEKSSVY